MSDGQWTPDPDFIRLRTALLSMKRVIEALTAARPRRGRGPASAGGP